MIIGVLRVDLYIDGARSLKDKRRILKGLIQRVRSKFNNVSISEVGSNDLWQKATIGVSVVSNETRFVNSVLDKATDFINSTGLVRIGNRKLEIIHF